MRIDLEAFREAEKAIHDKIARMHLSGNPADWGTADVLQWMLEQIDDLTKKVAMLKKQLNGGESRLDLKKGTDLRGQ